MDHETATKATRITRRINGIRHMITETQENSINTEAQQPPKPIIDPSNPLGHLPPEIALEHPELRTYFDFLNKTADDYWFRRSWRCTWEGFTCRVSLGCFNHMLFVDRLPQDMKTYIDRKMKSVRKW
jgi:hypothetical protein